MMHTLKLFLWKWRRLASALGLAVALTMTCLSIIVGILPVEASEVLVMAYATHQDGIALSSNPVITIGVGVDLSGGNASLGWQEVNSVRLAVIRANLAGGINVGGVTHTLALVVADSGCDPTQAITAASTLLNAGVAAVVGHTCSGECFAAQPLYSAAGVAMVSPSSTRPDVTRQGYTTTFRMATHDGTSPTRLASYFRNWLGLSRSAIVEVSVFQYPGVISAYSDTFTALGGTVTGYHWIKDTANITTTLIAIQSENPDVIANILSYDDLGIDPNRAGLFSRVAHSLGMTNVVIGWNSQGNDESLLTVYANAAGAEAVEDNYVMMQYRRFQDMPRWTTFLAAYQAAGFPNEPNDPGIFGPYAYDGARIIIAAIDRADSTDPAKIRDEIAETRDFAGVVGTYQGFDAYGDMIPQWTWLERYRNGQWLIVDWGKVFLPAVLKDLG
jgi:branched-chain amino acid transport system substrate-binding protein